MRNHFLAGYRRLQRQWQNVLLVEMKETEEYVERNCLS